MSDVHQTVREYVIRHTNHPEVPDDLDLFDAGLLSSLFAVQMVMWVERTFEIPMTADDLDMSHFSTVNRLVELVERKRAASARG